MSKQIPPKIFKAIMEREDKEFKDILNISNDKKYPKKEQLRRAIIRENYRASLPVINDLRNNGIKLVRLHDLVDFSAFLTEKAADIEYRWLKKIDNISVRYNLISALDTNPYSDNYPDIISLLTDDWKKARDYGIHDAESIRRSIGNYYRNHATDDDYQIVLDLATNDKYYGGLSKSRDENRAFMVDALGNMKKHPEVVDVLIKLFEYDNMTLSTINALGKQKNPKAIPYIEKYLTDKRSFIRQAAKKAIEKIEKNKN